MRINSVSNQSANFKSTYPVIHWVAETNSSYAPSVSKELTHILQQKLVRSLNKQPDKMKDGLLNQAVLRVKNYLANMDNDFKTCAVVRSFYNRNIPDKQAFEPISYMISGKDVAKFEDDIAKDIGRTKGQAIDALGIPRSAESKAAVALYDIQGLNFVKNYNRRIKDNKGVPYSLHTKFEIVRNKYGNIKDYRLVDARFLPSSGEGNPIARYSK